MPERLTQQFKRLNEIEPREEWFDLTRNLLVNRVKQDSITYKTSWTYGPKMFLLNWQKKLAPAPAAIFTFIMVIGLVFGTNFAAQATHRPSAFLYQVKDFVGDVRIILTISESKKAQAYLKRAEDRGNDALKLAQSDLSNADKEKDINNVVNKLKKDIISAGLSLDIVEQDEEIASETTDLAKKVTENTKNTLEILNQVVTQAEIKGVEETVTKAINSTEGVEEDAIQLLAKKLDSGEISEKDLSEEEISVLIVHQMDRAEQKISEISKKIGQLKELQTKDTTTKTITEAVEKLSDATVTATILINSNEIEDWNKKTEEANNYLTKAKDLLETKLLVEALKNIKESNQIINKLNEILVNFVKQSGIDVFESNQASSTGGYLQIKGVIETIDGTSETSYATGTTVDIFE